MLDVDQLHLQVPLPHEFAAACELGDLLFVNAQRRLVVHGRHDADDLALARLRQQFHGPRRRLAQHLADFVTALRDKNHRIAAGKVCLWRGRELAEEAHHAVAGYVGRSHRSMLAVAVCWSQSCR